MQEEEKLDPAIREAYMAMYYHAPKETWDSVEVVRHIILGAQKGRVIPESIMRRAAPVMMAKINGLQPIFRDSLLGLMTLEFREQMERNSS